jgi:hypothetical protein
MAIDLLSEKLRSFAETARRLPALRGGKPVNPATVWRWTTRGVRSRNGVLVRLEAIRVGGTCCTSDEALHRFFRALSSDTALGRLEPSALDTDSRTSEPGQSAAE